MPRPIKENRYIIRKYLRALSVSKNVNAYHRSDTDIAIKFFIILHNVLALEEEFYDECVTAKKEMNKYLHICRTWRVDSILVEFNNLYRLDSRVRKNIESIHKVEEIRYVIKQNPNLYKKLEL
jgi:hypothetical protein